MSDLLKNIVSDWNGFEEFVKEIHEDGEVTVKRDVTLIGNSGAPRQIDVCVKHQKGPYEYLTLIECKHWKNKVKRQQVENIYASMEDLNASKGVIFTTVGYQSGAEIYAKSKNISIYVIRDLTSKEWGMPGRVIELYIQILSKTILNIELGNTMASKPEGIDIEISNNLNLNFGQKNRKEQKFIFNDINMQSNETILFENQIVSSHKKKADTLEEYLELALNHALKEATKKRFLINNGEECVRYLQTKVIMPFEEKGEKLLIISNNQLIYFDKIVLTMGIKVDQSKFTFDRGSKYLFALAVEDCIEKKSFAVSKENEKVFANWITLNKQDKKKTDDVLENGSILVVTTEGFFDASEMDGLKEIQI